MCKINILLLLFVSIIASSCTEFLEEDTRSRLTVTGFYKTEGDAKQALNGIYRSLCNQKITGYDTRGVITDLIKTPEWSMGSGRGDYTFNSSNDQFLNMWNEHYAVINICNAAIDNITANQSSIKNWERYVAQATGIRAFLYFDLVRWFGDVPLVLKETTSLNDLKVSRNSQAEVFTQIITDFEYCISKTMDKGDVENGYQYGVLTKDACRGFLAKVYMWIGSVSRRDSKEILGTSTQNFKKALSYATEVIKGGRYKLVEYYPDVFNAKTREKAPDEVLWTVQGATGDGTGTATGMMLGIGGGVNYGGAWGNIMGTCYHRMIYEPSDSIRRLWNCPRVTILDNGKLHGWDYEKYYDTNPNDKLSTQVENTNWKPYSIGKFRRYPLANPTVYNFNNFGMDEPLLRYSDILLTYAEAYNEVNGSPGAYQSSAGLDMTGSNIISAYDAVNLVRKRARIGIVGIIHDDPLPRILKKDNIDNVDNCVPDWRPSNYGFIYNGVTTVWDHKRYGDDYSAFRTEILEERARELVGEATDRWCDLVRRGILVQQMQVLRQYNPFMSQASEPGIATVGAPENVKTYHMLFPIPQSEISINDKLTQNPSY